MEILTNNYGSNDQRLIEQIVHELKSQGIFDQFRKECISDVDTKPAYQNLRQRVENSVYGFLIKQSWNPEMNKNQVREMVRKNIYESGYIETGVERIVDQVVNPKINTIFLQKVEDVVYKFLGVSKPVKTAEKLDFSTKVTSFSGLLPKNSENTLVNNETVEKATDDVNKLDNELSSCELSRDTEIKKENIAENSADSNSSFSSVLNGNDSNTSLKQDLAISNCGSEKEETDNVTLNIKSEDALPQKSIDENKVQEKIDTKTKNEMSKVELESNSMSADENQSDKNDLYKHRTSNSKRREHSHSSSNKSKSKSTNDKDYKHKVEKHDIESKVNSNESKQEKDKYKIPKLSDKLKNKKEIRLNDKDRNKYVRDRKNEKEKKSSQHSRSRSRNKHSKKDRSNERDDKRENKEKTEKLKDDKKSTSSSFKKDNSSSRDRSSGKDRETSLTKKDILKSSKGDEKYSKKDEKDNRKKKESKDDHYSTREKKKERRSSDRDSDGPSNNENNSNTQRDVEKLSFQKSEHESPCSNFESSTGESGSSENSEENSTNLQIDKQKIKLPKFASNLKEAMQIMKIRKQLKKLESTNQLNWNNPEVEHLLKGIAELSKNENALITKEKESDQKVINFGNIPININDFISASSISMAKWNALEAKLMEEIVGIDYDSYESPFVDNDDEFGDNTPNMKTSIQNDDLLKKDNVESNTKKLNGTNNCHEKFSSTSVKSGEIISDISPKKVEELNLDEQDKTTTEWKNSENGNVAQNFEVVASTSSELSNDQQNISFLNHVRFRNSLQYINIKDVKVKDLSPNKIHKNEREMIVVLEKHALTEEIISKKNQDRFSENKIENCNILETEKEIVKANDSIHTSEYLSSISHTDKNESVNSKMCQIEKDLYKEDSQNNNTRKFLKNEYSDGISDNIEQRMNLSCSEDGDDFCIGLDKSQNKRNITLLNGLITMIEDSINKSKKFKTNDVCLQNEVTPSTRKRKLRESVETTDYSLKHPALTIKETTNLNELNSKKKKIDGDTTFRSEMGVYLCPIESKRTSDQSLSNNSINDIIKKKKDMNQRYSSEDLYKPRIFLRRDGNRKKV